MSIKGGSWIQVKQPDGRSKLIPKDEYRGNNVRGIAPTIMGDIEPFISPVDGRLVTGRAALRVHNREHGVTNSADYSPEYFKQRTEERIAKQARQGKTERIELIKRQLEK